MANKSPRRPSPSSVPATEAAAFYEAFQALVRAYQFRDPERTGCHGLSVVECYALEALHHGPVTVGALAATLRLDASRASRLATKLERRGLLERRRDGVDTRVVHLHASAEGQRLHDVIRSELVGRYERLLAPHTPATRKAVIALFGALHADLLERCAAAASTCTPAAPEP